MEKLLSTVPEWTDFDEHLYNVEYRSWDLHEIELWKFLRCTMVSVRTSLCPQPNVQKHRKDHERSDCIDFVFPWLAGLRMGGNVELGFGEIPIEIRSRSEEEQLEFALGKLKYGDAVGLCPRDGRLKIIVESAGPARVEHVQHTLDDAEKLLEVSINSLADTIASNKDTAYDTLVQTRVLDLQVSGNKLTLMEVGFGERGWEAVELRSCTYPTKGDDRLGFMRMLELVVTIVEWLKEQEKLRAQVQREVNSLVNVKQMDTVRNHVKWDLDGTQPVNEAAGGMKLDELQAIIRARKQRLTSRRWRKINHYADLLNERSWRRLRKTKYRCREF